MPARGSCPGRSHNHHSSWPWKSAVLPGSPSSTQPHSRLSCVLLPRVSPKSGRGQQGIKSSSDRGDLAGGRRREKEEMGHTSSKGQTQWRTPLTQSRSSHRVLIATFTSCNSCVHLPSALRDSHSDYYPVSSSSSLAATAPMSAEVTFFLFLSQDLIPCPTPPPESPVACWAP